MKDTHLISIYIGIPIKIDLLTVGFMSNNMFITKFGPICVEKERDSKKVEIIFYGFQLIQLVKSLMVE